MKNLKIGKKLIVTFGIIILLFCITVIVSIVSLNTTGNNFENFYKNGYEVTNNTMEMRRNIQSACKNIGYATMVADVNKTKEYIDSCESDLSKLKEGLAYLNEHFRGDMTLVTQFQSMMEGAVTAKESVYKYCEGLENDKAAEIFFKDYQPVLAEASELLLQINEQAMAEADSNFNSSNKTLLTTTVILIVLSLVALFITIVLAVYITRSLTGPIKEIEKAADKIVSGDLDVSILYESQDELGMLSGSMRKMTEILKGIIDDMGVGLEALGVGNFDVDSKVPDLYVGRFQILRDSMYSIIQRLTNTISQISQSSDQVSAGADQVSSGAQALSQGATEQASSVEELAATTNTVSEQIKLNAERSKEVSVLAGHTGEEMQQCNDKMQEMTSAMTDISNCSNEIGKIIKTIEDIAFQTNILALNAAVEAARAGEAGKGFAVVADEVRSLAGKSAEASKSTSSLIENSLRAVENGIRIANDTAASLTESVDGAKKVIETISQISKASEEQAQSVNQITLGIDQISSVVQTNSATSEESAAASEELSGQAQILKDLVSQFKLKGGAASYVAPQKSASFVPTREPMNNYSSKY